MMKNIKNMNNVSIGIDIEDVKRFSKLNQSRNSNFLNKIYTKKELAYCFSKPRPAQHLAARFCAKEAIIKAFASKRKKINYDDIEVVNYKKGAPIIKILNKKFKKTRIEISLSHTEEQAVAFVMCVFS